jgi:hypothetical protein
LTTYSGSFSLRENQRNHLPPKPSVNVEITVGGQNLAFVMQFRHAHETGIRQTHGDIRVSAHQGGDRLIIGAEIKGKLSHAIPEDSPKSLCVSAMFKEEIGRFCPHRLASKDRLCKRSKLADCPKVMLFSRVQIGDERAGVQQDSAHSPNPSMYLGLVAKS